jgi:hypothetical protein
LRLGGTQRTRIATGHEPGGYDARAIACPHPCARFLLTCKSCRHQRDADLQALIDAGRGDVPLTELRWKCARCSHRRIDMVVTSHANPQPW